VEFGRPLSALLDQDYPLAEAKSDADPTGWGASCAAQQQPADVEHCYAVYGKNPSSKQKTAREGHLKSGKTMPMANRRMAGLFETIRNIAFAHRWQHVQAGRFDSEEDVLCHIHARSVPVAADGGLRARPGAQDRGQRGWASVGQDVRLRGHDGRREHVPRRRRQAVWQGRDHERRRGGGAEEGKSG
jgi:hypothetical protein